MRDSKRNRQGDEAWAANAAIEAELNRNNQESNKTGLQPDLTADEQRQASQYARSLIEASLDPLVTISPEGKITDVNEATMRRWSSCVTKPINIEEFAKVVAELGIYWVMVNVPPVR